MLADSYQIIKIDKKDLTIYFDFIKSCITNSYEHTSYFDLEDQLSVDTVFTFLNCRSIYILVKDKNYQGIIVKKQKEELTEYSLLVHPRTCKLAVIQLAKACSLIAYFNARTDLFSNFIVTTTHISIYFTFNNHFKSSLFKILPEYFIITNTITKTTQEYINSIYSDSFLKKFENSL